MKCPWKSLGLAALAGLVVGLIAGFLPAHSNNTRLKEQISSLTQQRDDLEHDLNTERNRLVLSNFAVRASTITAEATANDYSVAGTSASALFTDLRRYVDGTSDAQAKEPISQVLAARDHVIAGLAQADPAIKPLLQQIATTLQTVSASANRNR